MQGEHNLGWSSAVEDNGLDLDFLVHVEQIHLVHLVLDVLSKSTLRSWGPPCLACPWGRPPPACQSRQWGSSHTHPDQSPTCNTSQYHITVCTPPLFPLEIKLKGNNQKCSFQEYRANQMVQLAVGDSYVRHCTSGGSVVIYGDADNDHSGNYHNYWEISGLAPSTGIYDRQLVKD